MLPACCFAAERDTVVGERGEYVAGGKEREKKCEIDRLIAWSIDCQIDIQTEQAVPHSDKSVRQVRQANVTVQAAAAARRGKACSGGWLSRSSVVGQGSGSYCVDCPRALDQLAVVHTGFLQHDTTHSTHSTPVGRYLALYLFYSTRLP